MNDRETHLARGVRAGDPEAVDALYRSYHRAIGRYIRSLTATGETEDLIQEVFLRVLRYGRTLRDDQAFAGWLFTIARNVVHTDAARHRRAILEELPEDLQDPRDSDQSLIAAVDYERLRRALAALPSNHQEVLVLSRVCGLRYREIARVLDIGEPAVKVRVFRALKALRAVYSDDTQESSP